MIASVNSLFILFSEKSSRFRVQDSKVQSRGATLELCTLELLRRARAAERYGAAGRSDRAAYAVAADGSIEAQADALAAEIYRRREAKSVAAGAITSTVTGTSNDEPVTRSPLRRTSHLAGRFGRCP